ncbi:MAG: hypothetical protein EP343_18010 [Deltaproteobacteria bacterium]|nr:MAG: hypothetical protein EP343_18010 [Deltaproteobacteria bacterium]
MLDSMRTHSRNWLIYLMFGAIILVFAINFGPGFDQMSQSGCSRGSVTAATVNGETISRRLYSMQWRNFVQLSRLKRAQQTYLYKDRVLDQLVQLYLLAQQGSRYGVLVPDEEVEDTIIKDTSFQREGIFDQQVYKNVTAFYRLTPSEYAGFIKTTLQADKVRKLINNGLSISDAEVKQAFYSKYDKTSFRYVLLDASKLLYPGTISDKEADAYAAKNAKKLKKYYDSNLDKFSQEKQVRASHILLKLPPKASAQKEAEVRKKMEGILAKARKNPASFADLAKKHSEGPSKKDGGDLNYFTFKRMVKPFSQAAFALKKVNDISGIVKTAFGLHIIKLTGLKPEKRETLSEQPVKRRIARLLLKEEKSLDELKKAANFILEQVKKGKSLKKALALAKTKFVAEVAVPVPAKKSKKPAARKAAKPTSRKAAAKKPAPRKGAKKPAARVAAKKPTSRKVAAKKPASRPTVVVKKVKKAWLSSLKVKTTPMFPKDVELIPGLKDRGEKIYPVIRAAFQLSKKSKLPAKPVVVDQKVYVMQFKKRTSSKSLKKRYDKEKTSYRDRLLNTRQLEFVDTWTKYLKSKASIYKNDKMLKAKFQQ